MIVLGIDPGFQGALAVLSQGVSLVEDTPVLAGKRPEYDIQRMYAALRGYKDWDVAVGIEEQGPRPFEGVVSVFRMGVGFGIWLGLLGALKLRVHRVQPAAWKKEFGLLKAGKEASVVKAKALWPAIEYHTPRGALKDGRAEALLIAEYTRRKIARGEL